MNKYLIILLSFIFLSIYSCSSPMQDSDNGRDQPENPELPVVPEIIDVLVEPISEEVLQVSTTYYVNNSAANASDSNSGSVEEPWATIGHGVSQLGPGVKLVVMAGTYDERVNIERGGESGSYAIVQAQGEVISTGGFLIFADYLALEGFSIENSDLIPGGWLGGGIWLSANNLYIKNNHFTGTSISCSWAGYWDNIQIEGNYITQSNIGIWVSGNNWLVLNNEVDRLVREQYDDGTWGGCDADYMRFHGNNIHIKGNYFHGTRAEDIGPSHTDIFQTYDNNDETCYNILIENNMATDFFHQGLMAEGQENTHQNIILRNNVFANGRAWAACVGGIKDVTFEYNTFYDFTPHGIGFRTKRDYPSTGVVQNNLFIEAGSVYWKEESCTLEGGYNLVYKEGVTFEPDRLYSSQDFWGDPLFVDASDPAGPDGKPFTADDGLRLRAGSPGLTGSTSGGEVGAYALR